MEYTDEEKSEIMNLIGYGLAKFDHDFIREFSVKTKTAFSQHVVGLGLAKSVRAVLNRQDTFDPYFDNGRKGWFQRNQRKHIKLFIDSLFGNEDARGFADIVKVLMYEAGQDTPFGKEKIAPTKMSKFKQLQETGKEAEFYFMSNYGNIPLFAGGEIEDARLWGDGYDFQILKEGAYLLAEVKGLREKVGGIRMTQNEYQKAKAFSSAYILVVVSGLSSTPKFSVVPDPANSLHLEYREHTSVQRDYYSENLNWLELHL